MAPLRLTDSELDVVWNAARPLEVQDRFGRGGHFPVHSRRWAVFTH
jgi:hypothetical protein